MRAETEKRIFEEVGQNDNQRKLPAVKRTRLRRGNQVRTADRRRSHHDSGPQRIDFAFPSRSVCMLFRHLFSPSFSDDLHKKRHILT